MNGKRAVNNQLAIAVSNAIGDAVKSQSDSGISETTAKIADFVVNNGSIGFNVFLTVKKTFDNRKIVRPKL